MAARPETMRRFGWRPIVSEAQAAQLLRHELKHHRAWSQRRPDSKWCYDNLLAIKPGNWFKYMKNPRNGYCSICVWRMPENHSG